MLKAENLTLNVDDEGGKEMPSEQYIISGRGRRNACHHRTKRRWKIHSGKDPDRYSDTGQRKDYNLTEQDITELEHPITGKCGNRLCIPAATEI